MTKRILTTGAASGFGLGTALELAKRGHNVIAGVHIAPPQTALMKAADDAGIRLQVVILDVPAAIVPWIKAMPAKAWEAKAWEAGKDDSLWIDPVG